jgi:hypothetical protein
MNILLPILAIALRLLRRLHLLRPQPLPPVTSHPQETSQPPPASSATSADASPAKNPIIRPPR